MSSRYDGQVRIGQLAAQTGVSTKTIRYYEAIDILPAPPRDPSGYRDYSDDAPARLGFIRGSRWV